MRASLVGWVSLLRSPVLYDDLPCATTRHHLPFEEALEIWQRTQIQCGHTNKLLPAHVVSGCTQPKQSPDRNVEIKFPKR